MARWMYSFMWQISTFVLIHVNPHSVVLVLLALLALL